MLASGGEGNAPYHGFFNRDRYKNQPRLFSVAHQLLIG